MPPILSIAIPTYNRAAYLALTLDSLRDDLLKVPHGSVEVVISDNCSSDRTPHVIDAAIEQGVPVRSIRNLHNIGSDANIAQVFNLSTAPYVLILGDDDILVPGTLSFLVETLGNEEYGVICLQPYGYNQDLIAERPTGRYGDRVFEDAGDFLATIGQFMTLISACVINKQILGPTDAAAFCGGNLVQVHLVIKAALAARKNLYHMDYSVACKRNNSGGYDFSQVFVTELGKILDDYQKEGLSPASARKLETRMIFGYYPYYLVRQRRDNTGDLLATYNNFQARFKGRLFFWIWLAPIITLPRRASMIWGGLAVVMGRSLTGDFTRGLKYLRNRLAL